MQYWLSSPFVLRKLLTVSQDQRLEHVHGLSMYTLLKHQKVYSVNVHFKKYPPWAVNWELKFTPHNYMVIKLVNVGCKH